ncbi:MAG: tRNA glutamyl-Q(34) synthetase GluQRS [Gallionella sp.]|nr:tRNA glutamyl-Q(34) synthetase GluQRS [Gallionella sp.]
MMSDYRGRFAPSPTGALHFGSLVAAVGSYLDAKHQQGKWLVRMEDLDTPRNVKGSADDILRTLDAFGLHWDESVLYQSQRLAVYEDTLQQLKDQGLTYPCWCSRKTIAEARNTPAQIYAGTCRHTPPPYASRPPAWRMRVDDTVISFTDRLQGSITQNLATEVGDFVLKRADGLFAYQLAVVVDDAAQGITDIVRGADLLDSTPRQIYLQRQLGLTTPRYLHLPLALNAQGQKLSKQTLAHPIHADSPSESLYTALQFLGQQPQNELKHAPLATLWPWAINAWQDSRLPHHGMTVTH